MDHAFTALSADPAAMALAVRCRCGRLNWLNAPVACCGCGRRLGEWRDGAWWVGPAAAYWGEVPQARMRDLLAASEAQGWRQAVAAVLPAEFGAYVADSRRAAFAELLPLPPGGRVLEVGAGLGAISAQLARDHDVVALEGVAERAQFLALRARQDGLRRLFPLCGDWHHVEFAPGQFDAIILNGVLEWAGVAESDSPPSHLQLRFLRRVSGWLRPGGVAYLAIENRFGWPAWRGALDHSGLPYTSLMPRWLARAVCGYRARFRSSVNRGYRAYTYSHRGYRRLLRRAGLGVLTTYVCPHGYNLPIALVPLHAQAMRFQAAHRYRLAPARSWRSWLRHRLVSPALYRWLGGDFAFVLIGDSSFVLPGGRAHA